MSFKRNTFDDDNGGSDNDQPFQKRQRFEGDGGRGGRGGRGRGRGRGDNFRGNRGGGGFRGRGGFNKFGNDDNDSGFVDRRGRGGFRGGGDRFNRDSRGGGGFRGRGGGRGFGGNRFDDRGRGRGRGGGRGRGFGDRRGGGFGGNRSNDSIIKVNQDAPDFQNIPNENSENVSLRQFRGRYVVLFIYFKDGTYGCSTEQKAFRDLKSQFDKHNAVILGVSRDDAETHKDAITEAELNFSLLADTDSKIINAYGALDENNRVNLCTFIISPEGKVAAVWGRVFGFDKHPQEVLDKLKEIASGGTNSSKKANHDNDNDDDQDDGGDDNDNDDDNDDDNNPANDDDDDDDDDE